MSSLKGKAVHVDERYLHVELADGRMISTPMSWYPELKSATLTQLAQYRFICRGTGIEWPELDYHLSIEAMFAESRQERAA
ncbi:hypothetical protein OR1_00853 [Geobacter sp. OR-1]|uniref:DUF2442 domain-containing protein n=1 Tax=Geobacter sp. OR-1 TaxID=1266765 RepID=UPI0005434D45|nr:DUF2442 domain-containing protein [Geobacter sp. OR-1]GAM08581.1 hypothetical protein OR1_00853 [Geobacter sp. OR-1]